MIFGWGLEITTIKIYTYINFKLAITKIKLVWWWSLKIKCLFFLSFTYITSNLLYLFLWLLNIIKNLFIFVKQFLFINYFNISRNNNF